MFTELEKAAFVSGRARRFHAEVLAPLGYVPATDHCERRSSGLLSQEIRWIQPDTRLELALLFKPGDGSREPGWVRPRVDGFSVFLSRFNEHDQHWPEPDPDGNHFGGRMWVSQFCEDAKLPLWQLEANLPVQPFEKFVEHYFAELERACGTYLEPFLKGTHFVRERDIRDEY